MDRKFHKILPSVEDENVKSNCENFLKKIKKSENML